MVTVRFKEVPEGVDLGSVAAIIASSVAQELGCDDFGGQLTPDDVEVEYRLFGPKDKHNEYVCGIMVDASEFPSRSDDLEERRKRLQDHMEIILDAFLIGRKWVWVRLFPASFGEWTNE